MKARIAGEGGYDAHRHAIRWPIVVRGSVEKTLEGGHDAQRMAVIQFPDEAQLLRLWNASERASTGKRGRSA